MTEIGIDVQMISVDRTRAGTRDDRDDEIAPSKACSVTEVIARVMTSMVVEERQRTAELWLIRSISFLTARRWRRCSSPTAGDRHPNARLAVDPLERPQVPWVPSPRRCPLYTGTPPLVMMTRS